MDIQSAVSAAITRGKWITRKCTNLSWAYTKLEPTNDSEGFVVHTRYPACARERNRRRIPRWQPQADDLLADDWILVSKEGPEFEFAIKLQPDTAEVMNTDQPDMISVNGVEIPSYYFLWKRLSEMETKISRLWAAIIVMGFILVGAVLVLSLI